MATIGTAIRLNDMMSAPLHNIIGAMNMMLSTWESLDSATANGINAGDMSAIRSELNQATIAVHELDAAMQGIESPSVGSPIEIPVTWETDNLQVFTNTGVERFQQEIQSANNMLNTLNRTQNEIARTAAQTDLFPAGMVADMDSMQTRLQAIQQRIHAIESNPLNMVDDSASAELEHLRGQLNQAVREQENLNRAVNQMDVSGANEAYLRLSNTVSNTERYIRDNTTEQGNFNRAIANGAQEANGLTNQILGMVGAYVSLQSLGQLVNLSDAYTQTQARLSMIVDEQSTVAELNSKIYASAQAARAPYQDMADSVAKLSLNAGDAFKSNDETILFAENLNKLFAIAGTEAASVQSATLQLTQALGSGVLRGEEFNAVFEAAPNIMQTVADYMNVPIGKLRELAADGQITADIVKNALLGATDEINERFESMPMTWAQVFTTMKNTALMEFQPVLDKINELANNEEFQAFASNLVAGLATVSVMLLEIFELAGAVAGFFSENWSVIEPIVMGIVTALGLYNGALLAYNAITAITTAITTAKTFADTVQAASLAMQTGATFAATVAQYGLNAALLACPITWIILAIIAVIAIIYAVVAAINKLQGTSISATGVIMGVLATAGAFIWNLFLGLVDLALACVNAIANPWIAFANMFGNIFNDPIAAIIHLFGDLASTVLGILANIASAIDRIFGSNLSSAVSGWMGGLDGKVEGLAAEYGNGSYEAFTEGSGMTSEDLGLSRINYGDAWNSGYSFGADIGSSMSSSIGEFFSGDIPAVDIPAVSDTYSLDDLTQGIGGIPAINDIVDNTGGTKDALEVTNEDLKYLRDLAEQEVINRFTTAEIRVELGGVNNVVNQNMDLDGVIDYMVTGVQEAMERVAEGVHI